MILDKNNCFYLGKISKSKGVRGSAYAFFDVDNLADYQNLSSALLDLHGELQPIFFSKCIIQSGKILIDIEGIDSDEKLKPYIGKDLYLPLNALPKLKGNKFYFHEVIQFEVIDKNLGSLGTVTDVYGSEINPLLAVRHKTKVEVLIPINDAIITDVDRVKKQLLVDTPEGLVDMYLE
jgi:16S rRNA processing protein RimM